MSRKKQPAYRPSPVPPPKPKGVWVKEQNQDLSKECYEMDLGENIRIIVMNCHIAYKGEWVMRINLFREYPRKLDATTAEEAKADAVEMAREIIEPIYNNLLQAAG